MLCSEHVSISWDRLILRRDPCSGILTSQIHTKLKCVKLGDVLFSRKYLTHLDQATILYPGTYFIFLAKS